MKKNRLKNTGLKGLAALVIAAYATHGATAEEDLFFTELPMVASVSRLPQKMSEAPASVTVIDRDMIRASGFRTVEDLLRLVPGFQVTSHNQDPALVAYHGLTGGMNSEEYTPRVQVLVDGRSQYSPLFKSGVNWNLLPVVLENIERIEVIRGSNTVAYGSNAALGVINIITQDTSETRGWMLAANRGVNFVRDETMRWGGKVGEADVRFTAHQLGDNGFQYGLYGGKWYDSPDSRRSRLLDLKATLPIGNQDEFQIYLSQVTDQSQFGRPHNDPKNPIWYLNTSTTSLGLEWKRMLSADEEFKLRYNLTQDKSHGAVNALYTFESSTGAAVAGLNVADAGGSSLVHEFEFDHVRPLTEKSRVMWGASAKWIALSSVAQFAESSRKHRSTYRFFGNLEFRPEKQWLLNAGASLERDSLSGVLFDPRVSVSYHITHEHTLRAVASRAHRTPSLYENQGRVEKFGTVNPFPAVLKDIAYLGQGVQAEEINTLELGYLGELKSARASADVRIFRERIPNRIQIVPLALPFNDPDDQDPNRNSTLNNVLYQFGRADGALNMEKIEIRGYEYQLRWQPFDQTRLIYSNALVTIEANPDNSKVAEINFGTEETNNTYKIVRQTRQSAPSRSQSAMLIQKLPYDIQASVMYFRASPMRWRRNAPDLYEASERLDWRLAKSFKIGSSRAELAYTVQMANEEQQGRQTNQRLTGKLHWMSLRLDF